MRGLLLALFATDITGAGRVAGTRAQSVRTTAKTSTKTTGKTV
ncbi:hypothetical protein L598_002300000480 [Mesorhizobium sp. J18]|nr:hypothetical protein [Mesorhizobium sp. J18]TWG97061.1 hypothetical protein L598_002300000480 [Mesorhizobium sp. J18]